MNTENLNGILAQYIQHCKSRTAADEGTIWRAVDCFGVNWDIDDSDFPVMFGDAMQQAKQALDNPALQPVGGLQELMLRDAEVELVRECFRWLFKEPAEALAHKLHLCIAQHKLLQTADRLQCRIVQRLLCLLHCIAEHNGKVTVIYIPVYAKAVHRAPDRTLIRRCAAFAVLDVLCKNSIEIFRVQTNSSYKKSAFLL